MGAINTADSLAAPAAVLPLALMSRLGECIGLSRAHLHSRSAAGASKAVSTRYDELRQAEAETLGLLRHPNQLHRNLKIYGHLPIAKNSSTDLYEASPGVESK